MICAELPMARAQTREIRYGAAVYGSFLVASVVGLAYETGESVRTMTATAFGSMLIFWLAHAWSEILGENIAASRTFRARDALVIARREWPLVQAAVLPTLLLALAWAGVCLVRPVPGWRWLPRSCRSPGGDSSPADARGNLAQCRHPRRRTGRARCHLAASRKARVSQPVAPFPDTSAPDILSPELERVIVSTGRVRRRDPARDGVQDAARPHHADRKERELEAGG